MNPLGDLSEMISLSRSLLGNLTHGGHRLGLPPLQDHDPGPEAGSMPLSATGVKTVHGPLELAREQVGQAGLSGLQGREDLAFSVPGGTAQHVVKDLFTIARVADTDAQSPEIPTAKDVDDVPQAIVAGVATTLLEADGTDIQIQFIVDDEDGGWRDSEIPRHRSQGLAAAVHEGHGLEQAQVDATHQEAAEEAVKLDLGAKGNLMARRQGIHEPEAHVMARGFVLGTRITQAHDELDTSLWHNRPLQNQAKLQAEDEKAGQETAVLAD